MEIFAGIAVFVLAVWMFKNGFWPLGAVKWWQ